MAEKTEAMVLQDGGGTYYAIPLEEDEAYRVADDKQAAVDEAVGADEVAGFSTINTTRSNIKSGLAVGGSLSVVGSFTLDVGIASRPERPYPSTPHR